MSPHHPIGRGDVQLKPMLIRWRITLVFQIDLFVGTYPDVVGAVLT